MKRPSNSEGQSPPDLLLGLCPDPTGGLPSARPFICGFRKNS